MDEDPNEIDSNASRDLNPYSIPFNLPTINSEETLSVYEIGRRTTVAKTLKDLNDETGMGRRKFIFRWDLVIL